MEAGGRRWCFFSLLSLLTTESEWVRVRPLPQSARRILIISDFVLLQQSCSSGALCHPSGPGAWSQVCFWDGALAPERPAQEGDLRSCWLPLSAAKPRSEDRSPAYVQGVGEYLRGS